MFCPACKSEFIEGITKCPVCDIKLIDELPPEPEFVDYKEILATYNPADVTFLKSLLDSEGISYFFKGEHFMYVRPLADPVRLMVRTDQVSQAIDLLQDVKLSITGINLVKNTKNK
jgi:putative signal transducing protein